MKITEAITIFKNHQKSRVKQKTLNSYTFLLGKLESHFLDRSFDSIRPEEVYNFLEQITEGAAKATRRLRYAQVKAFYNLVIESCEFSIHNPCHTPMLSKAFKPPKREPKQMMDKEAIDEMIYNSKSLRDRLILELMARCGLRIGELLGLKAKDVTDRKLRLHEPKSGRDEEVAFMPEQVAKRLVEYIHQANLSLEDRIFPICYSTARNLVRGYGAKLNVKINPHDLRRHSATYAGRNEVPLEIVSKVILRHQDLKTTRIYLGKVSDSEAIRWMDTLHER